MSSRTAAAGDWRLAVFGLIGVVVAAELYVGWLALHPKVSADYRAYYIDQSTTCLNKPVSGLYELGTTVSFMPDDQTGARRLRVCGWDGPAGDGTHSVGTTSMLRFAVTQPTSDLILRLLVTAIEAPDHRDQHLVLTGNRVRLGEATITDGATAMLDFEVPASAIDQADGQLDVVISYPTATEMTPRDSDTHYRSIKLQSVQLRRPGDRPSEGPQDDPAARRFHAGPD
ncbi:MAG: hypothetical protein P4M09_00420 [Devosia sp.]|nr:hypothetical protein [Devosia sp.]